MANLGGITVDELVIIEVDSDPSVQGVDAPLSSIALLNNGEGGVGWMKTGPLSTDWSRLGSNGSVTIVDGGTPTTTFTG